MEIASGEANKLSPPRNLRGGCRVAGAGAAPQNRTSSWGRHGALSGYFMLF